MTAAAFSARLAALALVAAGATVHAHGPKDVTAYSGIGPALRLADGSSIQLPCDKTLCRAGAAIEGASQSAGPRLAPLKRRAQVFDSLTPGVVASVRG